MTGHRVDMDRAERDVIAVFERAAVMTAARLEREARRLECKAKRHGRWPCSCDRTETDK